MKLGPRIFVVVVFLAGAISASCNGSGTAQDAAPSERAAAPEVAVDFASAPGAAVASDRAAAPAITPAVPGDPMGVVVRKLANGLTLMLSENHEEPRIDCWITTRAGSAKDPADATGLAHYLEHMNFKGTTKLGTTNWAAEKPHLDRITAIYDELFRTTDPAKRAELYKTIDAENQAASQYEAMNEFDTMYDGLGFSGLNAFTNSDQTSYIVNIPSNRLATWAKVETDRFREPVYRLFQSELEAVYEEKNRGMDNKAWGPYEARLLALYPAHPYGTQTTIGTVEHLKNPSLTKIYEYFHKWYVPGNMVVAVAGDFNTADALAILEKEFGAWEAKSVPADPVHPIEPPTSVKRVELKFEAEELLTLAWLTVPPTHPDADALKLADMMLANGHTGLIDVNINQKQLLLTAGASPDFLVDSGSETLTAVPKQGQTLEDAEKLLLEQLELLKKGAFSDEDLKAALTDFEISEKQSLESSRARVTKMTQAYIHRQGWDWVVHEIDRMRNVSKADVVRVANKYFGPHYVAIYRRKGEPELPKITKPGFTPVKPDPDRHSEYFRTIVSQPAQPIEPRFLEAGRDFQKKDLKSGRLVWTKNPANDLFQLSFTIDVGTDAHPHLATALNLLEFGGAGDLDTLAFKRKLYALGTTIAAGAGRQDSTISVSGLDANLAESVRLLREHFARPTGAGQADLDKLVGRIVTSRSKQKIDARAINGALGAFALRGPESDFLRQARNEEMQAWKADELLAAARGIWSHPRQALYVGPRPIEDVAQLVDLPPVDGGFETMKAPAARAVVRFVVPERPRILLVDKKATTQCQVGLFYPDGAYDRAAVPVHRVYTEYMSGSMGSVVFQEIRESRSLAYDAGAGYRDAAWKTDDNVFLGALGTQADKTLEAIDVLMRIVKEMPASEARMENTKKSIDETYRTARISFRRVPSTVVSWARLGLDGDPRPWNWEQAKKLSVGDVAAFASRWKTRPYTITIVGDKSKLDATKLSEFGEVVEMTPDQLFAW